MNQLFSQYRGLKKEIYVLFFGKLVTAMGSFVWPMMTFFLTTRLGFDDGQAALIIATMTTLSFPAALLGGKLADRFSRRTIIVIFDLATVTLYVLAALLPIGYHTVALVFGAGLFQTIESPAYDALNADFSTTKDRTNAFSLSYLGFNLGYIVGASLSGVLFEYNVSLIFLINGLTILVSTVLIFLFVHPENAIKEDTTEEQGSFGVYERPVDETRSVLSVLCERRVVLFMVLIGCLASMPNILVGILLPLQLKESPAIYGYLNSLNGAVVIVMTPLLTMLLSRITEIPKTVLGLLFFIGGTVLFALGHPLWILYAGMFVYTIGEVMTVLGQNPYTSRRIPASHRGRVGGITSVVYSLFSSLTQYVISGLLILTESNYSLLWVVFIAIGLVAVALYLLMYRPDKATFPELYSQTRPDQM